MSYVTDSLGWAERVRMENGAQNRFLDRFHIYPLYYQTISDRFNYQQDYELGYSDPNHMTQNKDLLLRSSQNFNIVPSSKNDPNVNKISTPSSKQKFIRSFIDNNNNNMSPLKASHSNLLNNNDAPEFVRDDLGSQTGRGNTDGKQFKVRPITASVSNRSRQQYVRKSFNGSEASQKGQSIFKNLNYSQNKQKEQIVKNQRFNEDLQSLKSFRSKDAKQGGEQKQNPQISEKQANRYFNNANLSKLINNVSGQNYEGKYRNQIPLKTSKEKMNYQDKIVSEVEQRMKEKLLKNNQNMLSTYQQSVTGGAGYGNLYSKVRNEENIKQQIIEKLNQMEPDQLDELKKTLRIEDQEQIDQWQENREQQIDDNFEIKSRISKATSRGGMSVKTSRTYISELEKKLNEEKRAREKLQNEVEELKRLSSAFSSQIGGGFGYNK